MERSLVDPQCQPRLRRILYVIDLGPLGQFGALEEVTFIIARAIHEHEGFFLPLFRHPLTPEVAAMYDDAGVPIEVLALSTSPLTPPAPWRSMRRPRGHRHCPC